MSPKNILITGCNRGIGLELIKQYLKSSKPPTNLFATCRDPAKADELTGLAKAHSQLRVLTLDVTDHDAFPKIAAQIGEVVGDDGLNLVINNAGLLPNERSSPTTPQMMRDAFEVNCVAPYFLSKTLLPLVKNASSKNSSLPVGVNRAAIVMMSTAVGSVAENSGGGIVAYRSSKTALNQAMKCFSIDVKDDGILVMSMHPGWVQTEMGGPNALITTETCCSTMLETLEALAEKDHGAFLRYNNTPIAW